MKTMRNHPTTTAVYQPAHPGLFTSKIRAAVKIVFLFSLITISSIVKAQLGDFKFAGTGTCPTQDPAVSSQPSDALFSNFSTVNTRCKEADDVCNHEEWNTGSVIDLAEYHQFSVTANTGYSLLLTSLSFTHFVKDENSGTTQWILRSSIDNYVSNVATGSALEISQTPSINLAGGSFTGINTVTFRLYLINSKNNSNEWTVDDVTLDGSVVKAPADPANPISDSPQCSSPGVTLKADGTPPSGETWYWQTSATGTSTANSAPDYVVTVSGTYYIRSQDNTTLAWSNGAGSITVTVTPDVSVPVFLLGASSTRCEGAGTVVYTATASNATGIAYSLDAASLAGGNTIDGSTGEVTYVSGWTGNSTIAVRAAGCNGPTTSSHSVTTIAAVGTPVFSSGASSFTLPGEQEQ